MLQAKGYSSQTLTELLANHLTQPGKKNVDYGINVANTTSDYYKLYFDGTAIFFHSGIGPIGGTGVVLIQRDEQLHRQTYNLSFHCTKLLC